MMRMRNVIIYFVLVVAFTGLMIAVHLIPRAAIQEQCVVSAQALQDEGLYPQVLGVPLLKVDNFTDALMLNMAYRADDASPIASAMTNLVYMDADARAYDRTLEMILSKDSEQNLGSSPREHTATGGYDVVYARYWHGHQAVLRPLLTFLDYRQILVVNIIAFVLTALICLFLVARCLSPTLSLLMLASLLLVGLPIVPLCLQFSTCFYLMFLSVIAILLFPSLSKSPATISATFFTIGALTSFFDLLTTPLLTLGFPLIVALLLQRRRANMRLATRLSCHWLLGYALLWASKCIVALLLTGHDIFGDFLSNVKVRSMAGFTSMTELLTNQFGATLATVISIAVIVTILLFIALAVFLWRHIRRHRFASRYAWLVFAALLEPVWLIVTLQHAVVHHWFVWRGLAVTFFAVFTFIHLMKHSEYEKNSRTHTLLQ